MITEHTVQYSPVQQGVVHTGPVTRKLWVNPMLLSAVASLESLNQVESRE